ncbi:hypothetical protein BCF44_106521 [Kutzneria buriramensis]|uniref:Uncharacterized protein n=1 Tax=Kutzneria buriramensis TaxID=1045776 RepID=A0A3E0HMB0_9PSEU|nr:hypothetical protein BCF44_106521 [Kutzneria buriramensis]
MLAPTITGAERAGEDVLAVLVEQTVRSRHAVSSTERVDLGLSDASRARSMSVKVTVAVNTLPIRNATAVLTIALSACWVPARPRRGSVPLGISVCQ